MRCTATILSSGNSYLRCKRHGDHARHQFVGPAHTREQMQAWIDNDKQSQRDKVRAANERNGGHDGE
jgi:hypothetical protein